MVVFQAIKWEVYEDDDEGTIIYIHGLDENDKSVCVKIPDMKPYVYLELDSKIKWTNGKLQLVYSYLKNTLKDNYPVKICFVSNKKKNYYLKPAKFLWMAFNTKKCIRSLERVVRGYVTIFGIGKVKLTVHEQRASPELQLFAIRKVKPSGWISAVQTTKKKLLAEYPDTFSTAHTEVLCSYKDISPVEDIDHVINPKVISYDIECISEDSTGNTFPNAKNKKDYIICISATIARLHDDCDNWVSYCLVNEAGERQCPNIEGTKILHFKDEKSLLIGWSNFINEIDPDIITGYNTLSFDDKYVSNRADVNMCWPRFSKMGRIIGQRSRMGERKWSSSAYKDQEFNYIDIPGFLHIDMYPVISKDNGNLMSYKLDYVAEYFLGDKKIDLPAKKMIQLWHEGGSENIRKIVEYCNKDTVLPLKIMQNQNSWLGLSEMSNVMMVSIFDLVTRGQQIRVFSQVYCLTYDLGVVCTEKWTDYQATDAEKQFVGATVQNPKSGYWELVATFDFCVAGDTPISLSNGTSKYIRSLTDDHSVLGYNGSGYEEYMTQHGLVHKGKKDVVEITLQYGKKLVCTPDHKLMTSNGEWIKACDSEGKELNCGIEYPMDYHCPLETKWILNNVYDMSPVNREATLAFSRMLGYILADGSIYTSAGREIVEVYLRTAYDAKIFHNDLELLTSTKVKTRFRKGNSCEGSDFKGCAYCITIPVQIAKQIHALNGIVVGKRATQAMRLPEFILNERCPLSVVREFLAGLFGGYASAPCYSVQRFTTIEFKCTTFEKYKDTMQRVFEQISQLLGRFHIKCGEITNIKIKYGPKSIKPKDYLENPRYDYKVNIKKDSCLDYAEKIGFRYCINKTYKLYIIGLYYNYCKIVRDQYMGINKCANELFRTSGDRSCKGSLKISQKEFLENNLPLHSISLSSVKQCTYMRNEEKRRTNHRISLRYKDGFPTPLEFLKEIGAEGWFDKGNYIVSQETLEIPSFKQKVLSVKEAGLQDVYDIEVSDCHNFIARGITTSNCSLYPSVILAYNICFSTFIPEGENPPRDEYHDLHWAEHSGCPHDTAIRKTKPTKVICGKHHYRFYKQSVKKGIIPMLLEQLLNARASTKKEMKRLSIKLKEENDTLTPEEKKKLKINIAVLNKRQLGYKVSANSMYGGYGSDYSYTPFYPAAASTTAMGRKSIQDAINFANTYRDDTVIVYGDSVTADTPVILKDPQNRVVVKKMSDFRGEWVDYGEFKPSFTEPIDSSIEYHVVDDGPLAVMAARHIFNADTRFYKQKLELKDWYAWTDIGWSSIKKVIKHKTRKKIYRITTPTGTVDITEDHSLLTPERKGVKPVDVKMGDKLLHCSLPEPKKVNKYDFKDVVYDIPVEILNSDLETREKYWGEYFTKFTIYKITDKNIRQKIWYLAQSIGEEIPIHPNYQARKFTTYNQICNIEVLGTCDDYVYDLETVAGRFQAGVGEIVVKNTDSCMLHFTGIKSLKDCFKVCEDMEEEFSKIFPHPMKLELEKIYSKYFLLSKKRYVGYIVNQEGVLQSTDKKGVVIKRRDNCGYLRKIYSHLIDMVMDKNVKWRMQKYLAEMIDKLLKGDVDLEDLVITKSIKENYKAQNMPHVAVSKKMQERGKYVTSGTRIRYIFIVTENKNDPQYKKAEDPDYYLENKDTIKIDYLYYYEKQLVNPLDEVLEVKFGIKDVLKNLCKLLKKGVIKDATSYFTPRFTIVE